MKVNWSSHVVGDRNERSRVLYLRKPPGRIQLGGNRRGINSWTLNMDSRVAWARRTDARCLGSRFARILGKHGKQLRNLWEIGMSKHHHNTTNEDGKTLTDFDNKAKSQEERILEYLKQHEPLLVLLTPSLAQHKVFNNKIPITSVRRALSNLTRDGHLEKCGKVMGQYGRPEHNWRLSRGQRDMFS